MKKMTQKEFKETFEAAGFNFEVWGWEGILNIISIAEEAQAKEMERLGQPRLAQMNRDRAWKIDDVLSARGYYESRI